MDKHFFNALMYDICNWSLNFTMILLLWSLNHSFCVAIVGLFVMRFGTDFLYRKSLYKEQVKATAKFKEEITKASLKPFVEDFEFQEELPLETPNTTEDKKVH